MNNDRDESQFFKPRIVGMGTLILLLGVAAFGLRYSQQKQVAGKQIGKTSAAAAVEVASPIAEILMQNETLDLSSEQIAALEKIESGWKTESKPLAEELQKRTDDMKKYMDSVLKSHVTPEEIMRRAAPMSEATAAINTLREKYRLKALATLRVDQRKRLEALQPKQGGGK